MKDNQISFETMVEDNDVPTEKSINYIFHVENTPYTNKQETDLNFFITQSDPSSVVKFQMDKETALELADYIKFIYS